MHPHWGSAAKWTALLQPELTDPIVILSVSARLHLFKQQPLSHAEVDKMQQKEVPLARAMSAPWRQSLARKAACVCWRRLRWLEPWMHCLGTPWH